MLCGTLRSMKRRWLLVLAAAAVLLVLVGRRHGPTAPAAEKTATMAATSDSQHLATAATTVATHSAGLAAAATPGPLLPRLVFTYYYYWWDATDGHGYTGNAFVYHLPPAPVPSWHNVAWHEQQFRDMKDAGIDVTLPVYWGNDNPADDWSYKGLPYIAQAWQALHDKGAAPPSIGMMYDTTSLRGRDLTTPAGKEYFYGNIKFFFDQFPRPSWTVLDGRPVIYLYFSDWTAAMNQSTFDYVYTQFAADFGVRPYIVREVSWDYPFLSRNVQGQPNIDKAHPIVTDNNYLWGAAQHGYIDRGGVAEVGPGYDDRLVRGAGGQVTDRQDGRFYSQNFQKAIDSGKRLLAIETWNEMHESSGICVTEEYGRKYIDLTRKYTDKFHALP
jgi:hypothetical protein